MLFPLSWLIFLAGAASGPADLLSEAARLKADGKTGEAIRMWERVWTEIPESPLAADALYLAAETKEEIGEFEGALGWYRTISEKYPSHRMAPRARARLDYLRSGIASGAGPLRMYEGIMRRYFETEPSAAVRKMEEFADQSPDFAFREKVLLWIADRHLEAGRHEEAIRWFDKLLGEFPGGRSALDALEGKGMALSGAHRHKEAEKVFLSMEVFGERMPKRVEALIARSRAHQVRRGVLVYGILPFHALCLVLVVGRTPWRRLRGRHFAAGAKEVLFVLPLLLGLHWILSFTNPLTARGVFQLLLAVPVLMMVNSVHLQLVEVPSRPRWLYPILAGLFAAGAVYVILYRLDLVFIVEQIWGGRVTWH